MIPFEHPNPLQMPEAVQPYPNIPRVPQEVVITREVSTEPAEPPAHPRPEPDIRITGPDDRGHTEVPTPTMPLPVAATPPSPSMANTGAEKNDADEPGAADIPPPESPAPAEPANDAPAAPPEESPSDAIAESPSDDPPPASGFPPRAAEIIDTLRYNFTGGTGLSESMDTPVTTNVYTLSGAETTAEASDAIALPSDSSLSGQGLKFVSRGETPSGNVTYPGRMEITHPATGSREVLAETTRHSAYQPGDDYDVIFDDRRSTHPPDKIRIDEIPPEPAQAADAVEALLTGYVADTLERITLADPDNPGHLLFTAEALREGFTPDSVPAPAVWAELIGLDPIGITRIVLSDRASSLDAQRGDPSTPQVAAVTEALRRFGCTVTEVQAAPVERSNNLAGIEIKFERPHSGQAGAPPSPSPAKGAIEGFRPSQPDDNDDEQRRHH